MENTIYALSTPFIRSAIAIIRVSGFHSLASLKKITKKENFRHSKAHLCGIYDISGEVIDNALVLFFEEGKSYTGETLVEYHIHGSISVIKDLLNTLSLMENHRLAEPGEFTKRALENGKIDIVQSEGIVDLINSQTSFQRKQALRALDGEIGKKYQEWYEKLKNTLAFYEATIDFSDEDIPIDTFNIAQRNISELIYEIKNELVKGGKIKKIKEGISLAIIGSPNVGKSSLINYLSSKEVAIVSPIAGTTRDVVEVFLDLGGFPVSISDTAGIRETEDLIEKEGVKRAIEKAKHCDVKIIMIDASSFKETYDNMQDFIDEETFLLVNKIDLNPKLELEKALGSYFISLTQKKGLDDFEKDLIKKLGEITSAYEHPVVLSQRQKNSLQKSFQELEYSLECYEDIVISSFHLRRSLNFLGNILGKTDIEEILGIIFSNFCIGK